MRLAALLTFLLALVVTLATWSIVDLLSRLDGLLLHEQVTFEMLLHGDVHAMLLLPVTWQNVPAALVHGHVQVLLAWRPLLAMLVLAALVVGVFRRRGWTMGWTTGLACLFSALLPWACGRVMLTQIESPEQCGPWLAFMLVSVLWGAVLAMAFAGRQLLPHRARGSDRAAAPHPA